jgi:hypothetical protein
LAVVVAVIAVVGGTSLVSGHHNNTPVLPSTTVSAPVAESDTISSPELLKMWDERTTPCPEPTLMLGPPQNRYGIVPDGVYPVADDITAKLHGITARGGEEFAQDRVQHLYVILLLTQSDMTMIDRDGSRGIDAAGGDQAGEQHAIAHARNMLSIQKTAYDKAVAQTITQIRDGPGVPVPADGFDDTRMCLG